MSLPASPQPSHQRRPTGLTLSRFFALMFVLVAIGVVGIVWLLYRESRATVLVASQRLMAQASARVVAGVDDHLAKAEHAVAVFERRLAAGLVDPAAPASLETALLGGLFEGSELTEMTFTVAPSADGKRAARQIALYRTSTVPGAPIAMHRIWKEGAAFVADSGLLREGASVGDGPRTRDEGPTLDPTAHATYSVPADPDFQGKTLWSDLAYGRVGAADAHLHVVTVQKAIHAVTGAKPLLGVLRVGVESDRLDDLVHLNVDPQAAGANPHRVFVCDLHGRLITRLDPSDSIEPLDERGKPDPSSDDLRVVAKQPPAGLAEALALPALAALKPGETAQATVSAGRTRFLASFTAFPTGRTQGWVVGVVVPERHYLGELEAALETTLTSALVALGLAASLAGIALAITRRDLGRMVDETVRMQGFDFAPGATTASPFGDVKVALASLEQAKTALRAMTKYVPLDLVRELYEARREPMLGGALKEVSILFTDIEGFTTVSERLPPDTLAPALGQYLSVMTTAIHATAGIIDKYTGDGVMALWNTPRAVEHHATRACAAVLGCQAATAALYATAAWQGLPPFRTRFGLHKAEVTVGHFGAPDRMSYTAMGDGVNLAARLESLGKQYGVSIIVSEAIRREVGDADGFAFRILDRVAVKGKQEGVLVFELCGRSDALAPDQRTSIAAYEAALARYFAGDFAAAEAGFAALPDDPPSRALRARCQRLRTSPPADWNGVFVATEK